jgi:hypothetical protein
MTASTRIPGQVGKDRLHAPEELERGDAYVNKLLKAAAALNPERAAELIIPRYTWQEFVQYAHEKLFAINSERDHALQGWEKLGFTLKEFRLAPDSLEWHPVSDLPKALALPDPSEPGYEQVARKCADEALAIVNDDRCNRVRQMTRLEAFRREYDRDLAAGLITKLNPRLIPALVGPRNCIKCNGSDALTVRNGVFEFEDWRIDSDPLVFIAQDENGQRLREGEKYVCYVNPTAPGCLIACLPNRHTKTHYPISVCPPMPNPSKNDDAGIKASLGLQRSWFARALDPMRQRNAPDAAQLNFMRKHNAALLAGGKTEAEKQRGKTLRRAKLDSADLLDDESSSSSSSSSNSFSDAQPASVQAESSCADRCASADLDPSALL